MCAVLVIVVVFFGACSRGPGIDKARFAQVYAAARMVRKAVEAGASYERITALTGRFSSEIAKVSSGRATGEELQLLKAYSDLAAIYRDGLVLWKAQIDFSIFDSVLKGRVYVGQNVETLVSKYGFSTESHLYTPTQIYWKSIPADSIRIVWNNADSQLKIIDNLLNERY